MFDAVMIVDQYQRFHQLPIENSKAHSVPHTATSKKKSVPTAAQLEIEAQALGLMLNPLGRKTRKVALIEEKDIAGQRAFKSAGFETVLMNGNRPAKLRDYLDREATQLLAHPPQTVVIVTTDPKFDSFCVDLSQKETEILIWVPDNQIPEPLNMFNTRLLSELLPPTFDLSSDSPTDLAVKISSPSKSLLVDPQHHLAPFLFRFAGLLLSLRWKWIFRGRLYSELQPKTETRHFLKQALAEGMVVEVDGLPNKLALNLEHPLSNAIYHILYASKVCIDYHLTHLNLEYVDSNLLLRALQRHAVCRDLGVGQTRAEAESWLEIAQQSTLISSKRRPHPKVPSKFINTWWTHYLAEAKPQTKTEKQRARQSARIPVQTMPVRTISTTL